MNTTPQKGSVNFEQHARLVLEAKAVEMFGLDSRQTLALKSFLSQSHIDSILNMLKDFHATGSILKHAKNDLRRSLALYNPVLFNLKLGE